MSTEDTGPVLPPHCKREARQPAAWRRSGRAASRPDFRCSPALGHRNEERLAHHVLAGEHLAGAATLLPYPPLFRSLLDEADVAVLALEIHRRECKFSPVHVRGRYRASVTASLQARS